MSDENYKRPFSPRYVNIIKINNLTDATIFIKECDFALKNIAEQRKEPFFSNDTDWQRDARLAEAEIIHKRELCLLKQASLQKKEDEKSNQSPEDSFRSRFVNVAQKILPAELYNQVTTLAMEARGL